MELLSIFPILGKTTQSIQFSFNSFLLKPHTLNIKSEILLNYIVQPKLYSAHSQGAAAKVCHQVCICSTPRFQGELTVHMRGWNPALNSFGLLQLRVSPGLIDVAKERASHVSIPEQNLLGSPRMDVSVICGCETGFRSC